MKIIKPGRAVRIVTAHVGHCFECGCVFECDSHETSNIRRGWFGGVDYRVAMCPTCGQPVRVVRRAAGGRREGEPDTPVVGGRYVRRLSELSHYGWAVYQYHQDPGGVIFPQVVASGLTVADADLLAHGPAALRAAADALGEILGTGYDAGSLSRCHDLARAALARLALAAGRGPGEGGS